jgi:hypothetical protein
MDLNSKQHLQASLADLSAYTEIVAILEAAESIETEYTMLDGVTAGTAAASKVLSLGAASALNTIGTLDQLVTNAIVGGDNSLGITGQTQLTTVNGGAVVIAGAASIAGATGNGGAVTLAGGASGSTNGAGGAVSATGGAGSGTGAGGAITVTSGASGAGATGNGGAASFTAGAALSTNGTGGLTTIAGGVGTGTGSGGAVVIAAGNSGGASGTAGAVAIDAGGLGGGTGAAITIGATNAINLALGRSGQPVTIAGSIRTSVGVGAAAGTGVVATEGGDGVVHQTTLTLTNTPVVMADEAGVVAYGGLKIYDMPAGAILMLGAVSDLDLTLSAGGINADWDGDVGIGTVTAGNDATLAGTEQNIIPTTATPQASGSATTANAQSTATENAVIDGTGTDPDVYLNFLVDDADHDVTGTPTNIVCNGTITLTWVNLGDY